MPTPTYTPLANITLGSSAASVTFSSISQAYRDLVLVCNHSNTGQNGHQLRMNNDSGTNYPQVYALGNGSTASSGTYTGDGLDVTYFGTANTFDVTTIQLMDYSVTDKHKSAVWRSNNTAANTGAGMYAGRWANTAAITTLTIRAIAGSIAAGSSFALYGIAS